MINKIYFWGKTKALVRGLILMLSVAASFFLASSTANPVQAANQSMQAALSGDIPMMASNQITTALSSPAAPLACPAGTSTATFNWSSSSGTGNEWLSSDDTHGDSHTYSVPYADIGGSPNTVDVTVTINDPANRSCDDNLNNPWGTTPNPWTSDTGCEDSTYSTETNGVMGADFLTVFMKSVSANDVMGFEIDFSKPVYMDDFQVSDVDYVGFEITAPTVGEDPGNSYQDVVMFAATDVVGGNVPVTVIGGSATTVNSQTASANYLTDVNGNIAETDLAGTVNASTSQPLNSFIFSYANGPLDVADEQANPIIYDWWSGTYGATNGASDSHAVRMSGFTFCVQDTAALEVEKSVSPTTPVVPGATLTYSIVVNNTGDVNQTDIVITDALPTGVTYVPSSSEKTYPGTATATFNQDMGSATFDGAGTFTQSYDTTGQIPAGATLVDYSFAVAGEALDPSYLSEIGLVATYPGGTAYTLDPYDFGGDGPGSYNETRGPLSLGGTAEGIYTFEWTEDYDDEFVDDNQIDSAAFTITYSTSTMITDAASAPPNLVTAADGIDLQPGETMTVVFEVTVDDPLAPGITELLNTASVTSDQQITPITDTAINLISGANYDFGDLPDTYNNTLLNPDNGARHVIGSLFLGAAVDAETDGQESNDGSGDGSDDDGLVRDAADLWTPGATVNIDATVTGGPGHLAGWFDWNGDGDFDDAGEFVDFGSVSGTSSLNVSIPAGYTTSAPVTARFRLFDPAALPGGSLDAGDYVGSASNGEVEDYVWTYGPTAVTLQGIRVSTNSSLLAASIAGFMMLILVSFGVYRFRMAMITRK